MHNVIATAAICGIICLSYIIFLKTGFDNQISIEHEKAIGLYLDRQLIARIASRLVDIEPLQNIISDITRYFQLDKIVIFKIPNSIHKTKEHLANPIYTYIYDNIESIKEHLSCNKFLTISIYVENESRRLLVQYLSTEKKYLIIYTANMENILSQNDIDLITEAVTPIMLLGFNLEKNGTAKNGAAKNGGFEKT